MSTQNAQHKTRTDDATSPSEGLATIFASSTSKNAPDFAALLENGRVCMYDFQTAHVLKSGDKTQVQLKFGRHEWMFNVTKPHLTKEICLRDLQDAQYTWADRLTYFTQDEEEAHEGEGGTQEEKEEDDIAKLMSSAFDASAEPGRGMLTWPSWILHEMSTSSESGSRSKDVLRSTMTTCNIFSANTCFNLSHNSEGTRSISVLSGSLMWIIWPPTKHNLDVLQNLYENKTASQSTVEISKQLEDGIIICQGEGDGLVISPLSLIMTLATSTTVFAERAEATYDDFLSTLQHLPFYISFFHQNDIRQPDEIAFINAIMKYIDLILTGHPDDSSLDEIRDTASETGSLTELCKIWDDVKQHLADMMVTKECKVVEEMWVEYLVKAKGRECRLCGKTIHNKKKDMLRHFVKTHWVVKDEGDESNVAEAKKRKITEFDGAE